jgi:hypothetical protein
MPFAGHGENDMVRLTGSQTGLLYNQPALPLQPRTLRAQPMLTGIVQDPFQMPLRTGLPMTTEKRSATSQDCLDRTTHISREWMMTFVHLRTLLQNALYGELDGFQ